MASHRVVQVASAGAPLTLVDVDTSQPGPGQVRIAVAACGVCGTDHAFVNGDFPGITWPLTLGHEIAGTIAELGSGVTDWQVGERVAVGWFGGTAITASLAAKAISSTAPMVRCPAGTTRAATPNR